MPYYMPRITTGFFVALICLTLYTPHNVEAASPVLTTERAALIQQLQQKLILLLIELQNLQLTGKTQSLDIKVSGQDSLTSYNGIKSQTFNWTSTGVQNCHLYITQGIQYNVPTIGSKTVNLDGNSGYVLLSCNSIATGEALNDYIYLTPTITSNP